MYYVLYITCFLCETKINKSTEKENIVNQEGAGAYKCIWFACLS